MNVIRATRDYEAWMAQHIRVVKSDVEWKHQQMTASVFCFLRATFYRWIQLWEEVCAEAAAAPTVLAVGDLHIENFGTWRDIEGRLAWGINDFDEVFPMPYTIDLVRLTASAHLATEEEHLAIRPREASDAVLEGYRAGLTARGQPFVLGEEHRWLRRLALNELRDPVHFWARMESLPGFKGIVPVEVHRVFQELFPERKMDYRKRRRVAGLGSLGHPRIVALTKWRGGMLAREAKGLIASAWVWARGKQDAGKIWYEEILRRAVRVPDPYVRLFGSWLVRRLSPDCSRIEICTLPAKRDEARLLFAMGFETANIHLGSRNAVPAIEKDLRARPASWLHKAAKEMARATRSDWLRWRRG